MNLRNVFQYRVRNNILEVFAVGKWRAMRYLTWNHRARRGIVEGETRKQILRTLRLNRVIAEDDTNIIFDKVNA